MVIIIFLRTLLSYFLAFIASLILITPTFILLALPKKFRPDKLIFYLLYLFYKAIIYCLLMPISIKGKENIQGSPVIFVANHQSSLDIPIIGSLSKGKKHIWLVLETYQNKFILGSFIKKLFITVNQSESIKAAKSLIKAIKTVLQEPQNIIIFPEGGRYSDGKIHPFFEGFAILVKKTNYPVIPVYMKNNYKIYPPYTFLIYYNKINVTIGKPLYIKDEESPEEFSQRVHNWFSQQIDS